MIDSKQQTGGARFAMVILLPAAVGLTLAYIGVKLGQSYGFAVFLGVPVISSMLSGYLINRQVRGSFGASYGMAMLSIAIIGLIGILVAMDGLICMLMALPLAAINALGGVAIGRWAAISLANRLRQVDRAVMLLIVAFPLLVAAEKNVQRGPQIHTVMTSIEVDAPIGVVWRNVVAFPPMETQPDLIFRLGIAYPITARIEGSGVGAIRYCEFSTGPFVEPITVWDEPRLLAFDVRECPPPMFELSPYPSLKVPHLHGFMSSKRGQFRLYEHDGKTILEGTTWYSHAIEPDFYWHHISDYLIHRIHHRVLDHIKRTSER